MTGNIWRDKRTRREIALESQQLHPSLNLHHMEETTEDGNDQEADYHSRAITRTRVHDDPLTFWAASHICIVLFGMLICFPPCQAHPARFIFQSAWPREIFRETAAQSIR